MTAATGRDPAWPDVLLWFSTIDAIIRGLSHALNNRALALGATIESLDPKRPVGQQLATGLTREAERLTEQLRQLRDLPFAIETEPMPLLLRDVLSAAIQLHRSHMSLGVIPVYLEGTVDAPPVLAQEPAFVHALLVMLTAMKEFASPGGLVRISYAGTPELAEITIRAERDPTEERVASTAAAVVKPTGLASALLGAAFLEIEQQISADQASVTWTLPSLRAMRRRSRATAV